MICFIHIEKTAGTTLDHIFINNFIFYFGLESYCYWTNQKGSYFSAAEFEKLVKLFAFIKGVGGHSLRNWLNYEANDDIYYVTFLRDPIQRYISHYMHQKYKMGIKWEIDKFIEDNRFNDYMTHRFSEDGDLNKAKENLKKIDFVGFQEDFDVSLLLLRHFMGMSELCINYESKNVNKYGDDEVKVMLEEPRIKNAIMKNNEKDIELYDFARREILQKMINNYPYNLSEQLKDFCDANVKYRFPRRRQILQKVTKIMLIRPWEIISNKIYHR